MDALRIYIAQPRKSVIPIFYKVSPAENSMAARSTKNFPVYFLSGTKQGLHHAPFHSPADFRNGSILHYNCSGYTYAGNMLPIYKVGAVGADKAHWFQH